jgi:Protein of unknown function (DUF3307)
MIPTFAALLFAHAIADFILQTNGMAQGKQARRPVPFALHIAIVAATATLALGTTAWLPIAALTAAHFLIDLAKTFAPAKRLWPFITDQTAHILAIAAISVWMPALWETGLWSTALPGFTVLPSLMALAAGLILATRAGGFAVGLLMAPWAALDLPRGLANGGKLIGWMERGLIFLLVIVGQTGQIGFLIAAKSILRFETASKDQQAGEYVIIGTLASFGWALAAAYATLAITGLLPPLGILPATP